MRLSFTLPFLVSIGLEALAATVSKTLTIANTELSPDGFSRTGVTINGQFPGPVITGNVGDTFAINVVNNLDDEDLHLVTAVHWHGFFQTGTNEMDGVDTVTQCPITPSNSFTYTFNTGNQAGTYWYHSHYKTQYCDGLRGALVVYDPNDPHKSLYDVDDESTIITLGDWYHFNSPQAPIIVFFNSTLINGKGRYIDEFGSNFANELAVVNVKAGTKYRMRVISMSCDPNYTFSIDKHQMTIIEVEGTNVDPLVVDQMQIFAGQRYSFVLDANQPVDNYWIRAFPDSASPNTLAQTFDHGLNQAVLRYSGAPSSDPTTTNSSTLPLIETNLHPLTPAPVPGTHQAGGADQTLTLNIEFDTTTGFAVNNVQYAAPSVPILLQILSGNTSAQELMPKGSIYELQPNTVVDIVMPGGSRGGPHPMHLHGHNFWVVRSAGNSTYNWDNPIVRDVVSIGNDATDDVTIRFETNNPGPWFIHSHIDWHLNTGLGVVMAESLSEVASHNPHTSSWDALCPAYNNFVSANPNSL
ncbi:multicopper oxidase [Peniophora sp. CONT]|nr:multicopper oxidase [Peniophora sp. CONT]